MPTILNWNKFNWDLFSHSDRRDRTKNDLAEWKQLIKLLICLSIAPKSTFSSHDIIFLLIWIFFFFFQIIQKPSAAYLAILRDGKIVFFFANEILISYLYHKNNLKNIVSNYCGNMLLHAQNLPVVCVFEHNNRSIHFKFKAHFLLPASSYVSLVFDYIMNMHWIFELELNKTKCLSLIHQILFSIFHFRCFPGQLQLTQNFCIVTGNGHFSTYANNHAHAICSIEHQQQQKQRNTKNKCWKKGQKTKNGSSSDKKKKKTRGHFKDFLV